MALRRYARHRVSARRENTTKPNIRLDLLWVEAECSISENVCAEYKFPRFKLFVFLRTTPLDPRLSVAQAAQVTGKGVRLSCQGFWTWDLN